MENALQDENTGEKNLVADFISRLKRLSKVNEWWLWENCFLSVTFWYFCIPFYLFLLKMSSHSGYEYNISTAKWHVA